MKKILGVVLALVVLGVAGVALYVTLSKPAQRPASTETVEITPARVQRGEYLAKHVAACFACHAKPDWTRYAGPPQGPPGAGGDCLQGKGIPGAICSANITPDKETGLGDWTDGEILRAMREGVDRDGKALFPLMPYEEYSRMSDEDAKAIVAYLRSMPAVSYEAPQTHLDFPVGHFIKQVPKPLSGPVAEPDRSDPVRYGDYLTNIGACKFCHSPVDQKHQLIPGKLFSGGHMLFGQWGLVRSANLTSHETGLGNRSKAEFIGLFRAFSDPATAPKVQDGHNTGMPWWAYSGMSDEDLGAIYDYLRSLPPVENRVEKWPPPEPEKKEGT
ncbi:MAG: cytochrome C [Acidobacteriota bacterium]